tara:strand:+ start:1095 stop:1874 length:780 start_codon:yes stop_codon:yes gene_type:complete
MIVVMSILVSCASRKTDEWVKLPKKSNEELRQAMNSISEISFDEFYAKLSTNYKDSAQNVSFKTSIRMRKDSVVNSLITYARIPVYNSLLSKDSIILMDKREKCVVSESLNYLKKKFAIDIAYENVEEMIFGAPISYKPDEKYFRVNDPYYYTLCSHRKREIKKNERKEQREIVNYYSLSEDLKSLKHQKIESPEDSTIIYIDYNSRQLIEGILMPKIVEVTIITPKQEIKVVLDYKKIRINEKETIHFIVPESYEECK